MSWLEKLLPPKIAQTDPSERRQVPGGLWIKCPSCETVLYKTDLEHNQNVCPSCTHHFRSGARARLGMDVRFAAVSGMIENVRILTVRVGCAQPLAVDGTHRTGVATFGSIVALLGGRRLLRDGYRFRVG